MQTGELNIFKVLPKYNSTQIQQLQQCTANAIQKKFSLSARNGRPNWKFTFNQSAITVSLFLLQLSFAYNPAFYFNMGRQILFSSTYFCYYRKHPNNDNKICPLLYSSCFQQFNFNFIHDPVAEYASFSHQARTPKTNPLGLILYFSKCYLKTSTICLLFLSSHVLRFRIC